MEWMAGLEPATSTVAWSRSTKLSYTHMEPAVGV